MTAQAGLLVDWTKTASTSLPLPHETQQRSSFHNHYKIGTLSQPGQLRDHVQLHVVWGPVLTTMTLGGVRIENPHRSNRPQRCHGSISQRRACGTPATQWPGRAHQRRANALPRPCLLRVRAPDRCSTFTAIRIWADSLFSNMSYDTIKMHISLHQFRVQGLKFRVQGLGALY